MAETAVGLKQFGESFAIRMIRDFFLTLLAVAALELGVKFLLTLYDYHTAAAEETERAAQQLAVDVKSIMLNSGGPVAAQTVYPILRNNFEEIGYAIAILPSEMTVTSIEQVFDFTPLGVRSEFQDGTHFEATAVLRAEDFCLQCHIEAKVGDDLGRVVLRSYLSRHLMEWWHEVQITGVFLMGNIILHTVVLFLLLKWRMAPLQAIRSMMGELAKAGRGLEGRAEVKSQDEFGQLAHDVNSFLDRIAHITEDLGGVLEGVTTANGQMTEIQSRMTERLGKMQGAGSALLRTLEAQDRGTTAGTLACSQAAALLAGLLARLATQPGLDAATAEEVTAASAGLAETGRKIESQVDEHGELRGGLLDLAEDVHRLERALTDMAVLEEKMRAIAEQGQRLLSRLGQRPVAV